LPEFITQNFLINYVLLFWENPGESGRIWENPGDSGRILENLERFCKIELKKQLFL
jgi:hypothetical protein